MRHFEVVGNKVPSSMPSLLRFFECRQSTLLYFIDDDRYSFVIFDHQVVSFLSSFFFGSFKKFVHYILYDDSAVTSVSV